MIPRPAVAIICLLGAVFAASAADWRDRLTPVVPGDFPLPRPFKAGYKFGWSSFGAGEASVTFTRPKRDLLRLEVEGRSTGFVRTLWRLDAKHVAIADAETLLPVSMSQTETYRSKTIQTNLEFTDTQVLKLRQVTPEDRVPPKKRRFEFPNLLDLQSSLLFVRSQSLENGKTYTFVAYPASDPYLATLKVLGREKISVRAGAFNAIKLELKLQSIDKQFALHPHSKFKRGFAWISDDADRVPLKAEVEIFVGSVWAELDRLSFPEPAKRPPGLVTLRPTLSQPPEPALRPADLPR